MGLWVGPFKRRLSLHFQENTSEKRVIYEEPSEDEPLASPDADLEVNLHIVILDTVTDTDTRMGFI